MPCSADVDANLLKSLKIVQSLGEALPHGGILKAVAGIGMTILETAERVRLNKEECADIAQRAATDIGVLKRLNEGQELSEDLIERLERYHKILEEVLQRVDRLGSQPGWKRKLRASSVQDETKDCLNRLNEAFRMYIFECSIATDNKLQSIVRGVNALSLRWQMSPQVGEADEIPLDQLKFGQEIQLVNKKTYVLRIEHAQMLDIIGRPSRVILRRFEAREGVEDSKVRLEEFRKEVELRHDFLNQYFGRMLGIASSKTGRTKMIVIEAGTIVAYDHLQTLSGLEYLRELTRIMCEFVVGYKFLREHRGSWRGRYHEILLTAHDKRLCMGGLGRMDDQWEDSGRRMWEAFHRLREGNNPSASGSGSLEFYSDRFERMRESVTKWTDDKREENARDLLDWLTWWSGSSVSERRTENSPSISEIGWIDGNVWHPIPLRHPFPIANSPQYYIAADRWREGEWETIAGTQIGPYSRWSIDLSAGEKIRLGTFVRSKRTKEIFDFFVESALSLARDFRVDVRSLRLVSRTGYIILAYLTVFKEQPSTVYYFAHPPNPDGSILDPPGFWSFSPDPRCADHYLQANAAKLRYHIKPSIVYKRISNYTLSVLQELDSSGSLSVPDITYASDPPFASITEVTDQSSCSAIAKRPMKRFGDALLSVFTKKRKTSHR